MVKIQFKEIFMQFIEIKIRNLKFERMGGGDPVKQMEERSKALEEKRQQEAAGGYKYNDNWNPFPSWLRGIIKSVAASHGSKLRYDDENAVFKLQIDGGRFEFDEFYEEFGKMIYKELETNVEAQTWCNDNQVLPTSTADDENLAMEDLKEHHGDKSKKPIESEVDR